MSSKWGWATLVAFTGILVTAEWTLAQQDKGGGRPRGFGGGMGGRGGMVMLAGNAAVQAEIGIGEAEKEQIMLVVQAFGDEMREQLQAAGGNLLNATNEVRQQMMAKMQALNEKYSKSIKEILKPEQSKRLQQISWQAGGAQAFNDPELVKALDLSKEQQDKIAAVNQEFQTKQFGLFGGGAGGEQQDRFAKMRELGQERDRKANEVLTKEQQAKFGELKGKPFDLAQLQPGGPGGRPGAAGRPGGDKKKEK